MTMQGIRKIRGFTLMELMIAVAVVGILAAVAFPSYQSQVIKTRRSDGKAALMAAAAKQEQYYLDNKTYANSMTALGYAANPANSQEGYYQISIAAATAACPIATCFSLTATGQGSQQSDGVCGNLTLSSSGAKGITGTGTVANCW
ncbi:type IV pilin protein [Methylocaldum sp. 14B]|jgi:type IV pilus assembly protein PilE|uniref:type IV pilin protein n=1 Tax=unclassified Methylocaldum TaxID=2622260 RepID=UPI0023E36916|nr:type IV pilin protein [Methylocaldum sp. 14B]